MVDDTSLFLQYSRSGAQIYVLPDGRTGIEPGMYRFNVFTNRRPGIAWKIFLFFCP
jgi:hypothetical protein